MGNRVTMPAHGGRGNASPCPLVQERLQPRSFDGARKTRELPPLKGSSRRDQPSNSASSVIGTADSAFDTGQFCLASSAMARNFASSMPGPFENGKAHV